MRLFIDQKIQIDKQVLLDSNASNYIARVLRLKINDTITLFNGQQPLGEYLAKISQINKKQVSIQVIQFDEKNTESPITINLLQGISRGDKMDYTIQKAVELGVNKIYPLLLDRSNIKLGDQKRIQKKLSHWQAIAHSAIQQSGRTTNVIVTPPALISSIETISANLKLLPDPQASSSLSDLTQYEKPESINILIGSEGGITDNERDYAKTLGYLPIRMGPRILRTETAGLALISSLQTIWGDF